MNDNKAVLRHLCMNSASLEMKPPTDTDNVHWDFGRCTQGADTPKTWKLLGIIYSMHTHTRLTAPFPGLPRWAVTRKVKPILILLKQETVSGSGISWVICKSAARSRQITTPAPHHSFFTGRMPFLPPNQQRQSTEGNYIYSTLRAEMCNSFATDDAITLQFSKTNFQ